MPEDYVGELYRIRDEIDQRWSYMTREEINREIVEGAAEGHRIIEEIRRQKSAANRPDPATP